MTQLEMLMTAGVDGHFHHDRPQTAFLILSISPRDLTPLLLPVLFGHGHNRSVLLDLTLVNAV
jgi:hypothetical protein